MLIHTFALLGLHDLARQQITNFEGACTHLRKEAAVCAPASAFFSALLRRCGCPLDTNPRALIIAYAITQFGFENPDSPQKVAVMATSVELTATVQLALQQCGTSETATLGVLPLATRRRFKAAAAAQVVALMAFQESDIPVLCGRIEAALEKMYLRQAEPTTPVTERRELAFHINRLRTKYQRMNPDGLTAFDARLRG
jgi:hypothetical protein